MLLYFAFTFALLACLLECYLLINYVRCRGKYPPFVISFGKIKKDIIQKSCDILLEERNTVKVVDLGCGSGSLLVPLAKRFPNHKFYGYEWDVFPYLLASFRAKKTNNLTIYKKNFMNEDMKSFKLILCNVGTGLKTDLGYKLNNEISKEATVLSEIFELDYLQEKEVIPSKMSGFKTNIYLYVADR